MLSRLGQGTFFLQYLSRNLVPISELIVSQTDMTRGGGTKTPDEGAQTPVMLALEDISGRTGLFWQSEKVVKW